MNLLQILLYPFIFVYRLFKLILVTPLYLIKNFGIGLVFIISKSFKYLYIILKWIFKYIKLIVAYLFKIIRLLLGYFFVGVASIIKVVLFIIKFIFKYLFKLINYIIKGLSKIIMVIFSIVKLFVIGLITIFKKIYSILKYIITMILKVVGFLFNIIIVRYLYGGLKVIYKYVYMVFKFIFKYIYIIFGFIFKYIGIALKYIFYTGPIKFYGLFSQYIDVAKGWIGQQLNNLGLYFKDVPKKIKVYFVNKYNNMAIVKYLKNKKDMNRKVLLIDFDDETVKRTNTKLTYKYLAKNADGKIVSGYFDAFSKIDVHSFLLSEGYELYSIKTNKLIQMLSSSASIKKYKIKQKDIAFMLTQFSTYIKSGVTLVDSIKILSRQSKDPKRKKIFDNVIYELVMGESLSEALNKQGDAFPKLLINMIKTSEMTGKITEVLDNMAEYYDAMDKTRKQMITAMIYPMFVFVMSTLVVSFVLIFIVPEFIDMFNNMDTKIPTITQIVINASTFMQKYYIFLGLGIFVLVFLFRLAYKSIKFFRYTVQWLMMHFPVIGNIVIYNEVTMFSKTFGSLLIHNVFITDSMDILSKITNNEIYKLMVYDTVSNLARGDEISAAFKGQWAFPQVAYEMLLTGEKTGQLGQMMLKVGDYYQEQHKNAVGQIKSFIEPVMITFLAGMVGTILMSIVIPMFSMYQQF
jgi:type IV pilus assembly protein PilC